MKWVGLSMTIHVMFFTGGNHFIWIKIWREVQTQTPFHLEKLNGAKHPRTRIRIVYAFVPKSKSKDKKGEERKRHVWNVLLWVIQLSRWIRETIITPCVYVCMPYWWVREWTLTKSGRNILKKYGDMIFRRYLNLVHYKSNFQMSTLESWGN